MSFYKCEGHNPISDTNSLSGEGHNPIQPSIFNYLGPIISIAKTIFGSIGANPHSLPATLAPNRLSIDTHPDDIPECDPSDLPPEPDPGEIKPCIIL
ncbi:MAG: hypothetical protein L6305_08725 [Actinomycetia bacterium]|nr:hypothetical protein [Actinomycetes bacterium]